MRGLLARLLLGLLALAPSGARAQLYVRTRVEDRPRLCILWPPAPARRPADAELMCVDDDSDLCVLWPGREYVYHLDAAGSSRTPGDTEFAAIEAAVASWRALSATCSDYVFTRGADVQDPRVGYDTRGTDNQNVITFRESDCNEVVPAGAPCLEAKTCANTYKCWEHGNFIIGLTTTTYSKRTGYILDADIELNAAREGHGYLFTTVDSPPCGWNDSGAPCVSADVQNTMTHELGHVVGLDHVFSREAIGLGSTMEPSAPPGETHKRVIDAGSAEGFCSIYPRGLPPTQCGESPTLGRRFKTVSSGTGCSAAPGALALPGGLWAAWGLGRRRRAGRGR